MPVSCLFKSSLTLQSRFALAPISWILSANPSTNFVTTLRSNNGHGRMAPKRCKPKEVCEMYGYRERFNLTSLSPGCVDSLHIRGRNRHAHGPS
ncbi:hypothetical protein IF1G_10821 [Cordyceps javanica]|uniref:Uncharacterized protein n=1 Tax=Cordyceps javanica TaxID=43265 RepID=A0A545UM07_9HYPO|nr:hypothetical protein IF1G_10821 [Cordyceps javanica]